MYLRTNGDIILAANQRVGAVTEECPDSVEARLAALEAEVDSLDSKLTPLITRDIPLLTGSVRALVDEEIDNLEAFPAAARRTAANRREARVQLETVRSRVDVLGDIGAERTSKEEKIAAVLAFAFNKRGSESKVSVTPDEVRGCTGVSRRYAYDLVEAIGSSVNGCRVREAEVVQTSTGSKRKPKALLIDCDAVQHQTEGVNKLTTGGET